MTRAVTPLHAGLLMLLAACGGSGGGGGDPAPPVAPAKELVWGSGSWGVNEWGATLTPAPLREGDPSPDSQRTVTFTK